jgi:hypothetical protein
MSTKTIALSFTAACITFTLGMLAACPLSHASGRYNGRDCPVPTSVTPWHYKPTGCIVLGRNDSATLPRAATELDLWSLNGRTHLRQTRALASGGWAFDACGYSAGWVTVNRDVFNYGRPVIAYYWQG